MQNIIHLLSTYHPHWRKLTSRERDVCILMIQGKKNQEVAHSLGISHRTVERYRQNALSKLKAKTPLHLLWHTFKDSFSLEFKSYR
ncbi:LuxR C-terminal-related transcriptional regulator [Basilea psittacipulmonis]|uniref:HTH luxR-type domain-containing protein n=1 Tax=Basilea psittacipulmonis DSM 24701 TaxID=1072685 RepID=A0A077DE06_9BURK|nr:helix-turn-helix transcriptional regulator [Basilea psittacipulmonis]AIL32381.1 hypothetical protein IX83_02770 [Basilea psittacipulmonis DSM 24701]